MKCVSFSNQTTEQQSDESCYFKNSILQSTERHKNIQPGHEIYSRKKVSLEPKSEFKSETIWTASIINELYQLILFSGGRV